MANYEAESGAANAGSRAVWDSRSGLSGLSDAASYSSKASRTSSSARQPCARSAASSGLSLPRALWRGRASPRSRSCWTRPFAYDTSGPLRCRDPVAKSRVLLGARWFSDVFRGLAFGWRWLRTCSAASGGRLLAAAGRVEVAERVRQPEREPVPARCHSRCSRRPASPRPPGSVRRYVSPYSTSPSRPQSDQSRIQSMSPGCRLNKSAVSHSVLIR